MTDDTSLVASARADPRGFGAIYERYGDRIHDYCQAVLRHREDAADAAQDTFLIAYERLGQLRDPGRLKPWLYAIARSRCLRRIQDRGRQRPTEDLDPLSPTAPEASGEAESAQLRQLVWDAAAGLADDDRAVLDLHLRQGLSGGELADALGVSPEKANLMLHRMKQRMGRTIGALLVARTGRRDCPDLAAITTGQLTPLIRKRLARHVDRCATCRDRRGRLTPELLYASVPLVPAPLVIGQRLPALITGTTTDLSGAMRWQPDGFPRPVRAPVPMPTKLGVAAGVAALLVLGLLGGLVTGRTIAGGGPPGDRAAVAPVAPGSTPPSAGPESPTVPAAGSGVSPASGRPAPGDGTHGATPAATPTPSAPAPTVRITSPADGETVYELSPAIILDSAATDPAGGGLDYTWSVTYPYDPATGTGTTTEVITPIPLWPAGALWQPVDTFDTHTWCGLHGQPIRLELRAVDVEGRTGSDHIVLHSYPCPVVD
jgi:RNA polymerase sigma factor (sigma-70 family)